MRCIPLARRILIASLVAATVYSPLGTAGGRGGEGGDDPPRNAPPGRPDGAGHPGGPGDHGQSGSTPAALPKLHPPAAAAVCGTDDGSLVGPVGQAGSSHAAHVDFGPLDPTTGQPAATPASGRMMYFWVGSTFDYVLNAHGLPAATRWVLTYQPEPLPSPGVLCLGQGTVNGGGQLHLAASVELNSHLPPGLDPYASDSTTPDALLALVPADDVDCANQAMLAVHADTYRFSAPRVRYVDSDLLAPAPTGQ